MRNDGTSLIQAALDGPVPLEQLTADLEIRRVTSPIIDWEDDQVSASALASFLDEFWQASEELEELAPHPPRGKNARFTDRECALVFTRLLLSPGVDRGAQDGYRTRTERRDEAFRFVNFEPSRQRIEKPEYRSTFYWRFLEALERYADPLQESELGGRRSQPEPKSWIERLREQWPGLERDATEFAIYTFEYTTYLLGYVAASRAAGELPESEAIELPSRPHPSDSELAGWHMDSRDRDAHRALLCLAHASRLLRSLDRTSQGQEFLSKLMTRVFGVGWLFEVGFSSAHLARARVAAQTAGDETDYFVSLLQSSPEGQSVLEVWDQYLRIGPHSAQVHEQQASYRFPTGGAAYELEAEPTTSWQIASRLFEQLWTLNSFVTYFEQPVAYGTRDHQWARDRAFGVFLRHMLWILRNTDGPQVTSFENALGLLSEERDAFDTYGQYGNYADPFWRDFPQGPRR